MKLYTKAVSPSFKIIDVIVYGERFKTIFPLSTARTIVTKQTVNLLWNIKGKYMFVAMKYFEDFIVPLNNNLLMNYY